MTRMRHVPRAVTSSVGSQVARFSTLDLSFESLTRISYVINEQFNWKETAARNLSFFLCLLNEI